MATIAGLLRTIILLGGIQGGIITALLFSAKRQRLSNRLLAALIMCMTLASFNLLAQYYNWFNSEWLIFFSNFIPLVIIMPIGPLIFLYVRSFSEPGFVFSKIDRLHFLPVIIDLVPALVAIVYAIGVISGVFRNYPRPIATFIDTYNVYADLPRWLSISVYLWFTAKYLRSLKAKQPAEWPAAKWLQQFVRIFLGFQLIWLCYLVPYIIPRYNDWVLNTFDWYPVYVPLAVLIYWLGIKGYISTYQYQAEAKRSEQTPLPEDTVSTALSALTAAMEKDHLYLKDDLSLATLGQHTGLAPKTISAVLNQHVGKNFNEYINAYRVQAFKEKMQQPGADQFTIASLAYDCGFSSLATFQRTFRQVAGMSPSAFRKQALNIP